MSQYNYHDSIKVKARAGYRCEVCGSDQMVQAHAPGGDHSDWRNGQCLCNQHHSEQHPELPRELFFAESQQPYWSNISANALAVECGCHNRTVIRASRRLGVPSGGVLSESDKRRLEESVRRHCYLNRGADKGRRTISRSPKVRKVGSRDYKCIRCGHFWSSYLQGRPKRCPNPECGSPYWDKPYSKRTLTMVEHIMKAGAV